jgi:hypothetical protein
VETSLLIKHQTRGVIARSGEHQPQCPDRYLLPGTRVPETPSEYIPANNHFSPMHASLCSVRLNRVRFHPPHQRREGNLRRRPRTRVYRSMRLTIRFLLIEDHTIPRWTWKMPTGYSPGHWMEPTETSIETFSQSRVCSVDSRNIASDNTKIAHWAVCFHLSTASAPRLN